MIAVIDYGMGNLRSVQKALEVVGAKAIVTSKAKEIERSSKIVFPGVGAFGESMRELRRFGLIEPIKAAIDEGKPFLGLCLGLQLLFEKSEEDPGVKGLCVFKGESKKFKFAGRGLKVPHMGWNNIKIRSGNPGAKILKGVKDSSYMYFVHSYYVRPADKSLALTTTNYGIDFASGVSKDNIFAFQFHPEKSQETGLKILSNFVRI